MIYSTLHSACKCNIAGLGMIQLPVGPVDAFLHTSTLNGSLKNIT